MKSIADELALIQNPVNDEDLMVHILCQLGDDFKNVAQSLRLLDSKLTFPELFEKLVDFERELSQTIAPSPLMATANFTQKHSKTNDRFSAVQRNTQSNFNNRPVSAVNTVTLQGMKQRSVENLPGFSVTIMLLQETL